MDREELAGMKKSLSTSSEFLSTSSENFLNYPKRKKKERKKEIKKLGW
jgi:hypothetical protein